MRWKYSSKRGRKSLRFYADSREWGGKDGGGVLLGGRVSTRSYGREHISSLQRGTLVSGPNGQMPLPIFKRRSVFVHSTHGFKARWEPRRTYCRGGQSKVWTKFDRKEPSEYFLKRRITDKRYPEEESVVLLWIWSVATTIPFPDGSLDKRSRSMLFSLPIAPLMYERSHFEFYRLRVSLDDDKCSVLGFVGVLT
ncbi:hypothetical protein HAX54_052923 [Datura stramonium]|uniref:Uncharacterized protein n=1 Tax=Datura stramonium TaxID=4076 RepID=A0ABS8WRH2_DATST|nr:hypothetical protein [Datura stramonium]